MAEETRVEVLLKRIKNNRWLSYAIVAGIAFLGVVSFAKGVREAGEILGEAFSSASLGAQYDASTKEALLAAARKVDGFFLTIEASPKKTTFADVAPTFLEIKADLRSILLRNQVRPLNEIAVRQSELLLDSWGDVEKLLRIGVSKDGARMARVIMFVAFTATLRLEEAKKREQK